MKFQNRPVQINLISPVNPARLDSITVGVSGSGVAGTIYVDAIRTTRALQPVYDLAAQFPLEGDALDVSGNGFDGTIVGDPNFIEGAIGQALEFNGSDQYVDLGTFNPSLGSTQLSLALWAKWNDLSGQWQGLIGKRDAWNGTDTMWQIEAHRDSGVLSFARNGSSLGSGDRVLPVGEWQHVGVSFDGSTAKFFVDGAVTNEGGFSFGPATDAAVIFGCCQANGGNPFNGALDEIQIYDTGVPDILEYRGIDSDHYRVEIYNTIWDDLVALTRLRASLGRVLGRIRREGDVVEGPAGG